MRVTAVFHGVLSEWVGVERAEFDLRDGASLADLLAEIGKRYRRNMPEPLWNDEANAFAGRVLAFCERRCIGDPRDPLHDGQEVRFFLTLAGG